MGTRALTARVRMDEGDAAAVLAGALMLREVDPEGAARLAFVVRRWCAGARGRQQPTLLPADVALRCAALSEEFAAGPDLAAHDGLRVAREAS